jgi:alkyl hydroperoxide reductase subunit AhpC
MIQIGQQFPHIRVSTFVKGTLTYFDFSAYRGRWIACCCVLALELVEITFLDRQTHRFAHEGALLLAVSPNAKTFPSPWFGRTPPLDLTLRVDPLKRLHRSMDIPALPDRLRCQSFLIDPEGILRFHLVHALNGRGIDALKEMLIASQGQKILPLGEMNSPLKNGAITICVK